MTLLGACSEETPPDAAGGDRDANAVEVRAVDAGADDVTARADADGTARDAADDATRDAADAADALAADVAVDAPVDAGPPCGGDPQVGRACVVTGSCEAGVFTCVSGAVRCVGSGRGAPATTECRPARGACDVAERCDGSSLGCPDDAFAPVTTVCRPSANIEACDPAERCTGASAECPTNTVTRAPAAERCNHVDDDCDGLLDGTDDDAHDSCGAMQACDGTTCLYVREPRPLSPLSTARVTSRRPTLRWSLGANSDGVRVEVCRDRLCTSVVTSFDALGTAAAPASDLPPGVLFWRLRGRRGTRLGAQAPMTWQFTVGPLSASANDTSGGTTLDVNGDGYADLAVSAPQVSTAQGRVYVYLGGAAGVASAPSLTLLGPDGPNAQFGVAVSSGGDVNGDGYADLLVGAPNIGTPTGRVHVFFGSPSGLSDTPSTRLASPEPNSGFGKGLTPLGDVNGDGYADVLVRSTSYATDRGRAWMYFGGPTGVTGAPALTLANPGAASVTEFGASATANDFNGDGFGDLAVGASNMAATGTSAVYVYPGSALGLAATPAITLTGPSSGSDFGRSLSSGDIDGDGLAELVVGAPFASSREGRVMIYAGARAGLATAPTLALSGPERGVTGFGWQVEAADYDGDGRCDVLVGAPLVDTSNGVASVFLGGPMGLATARAGLVRAPDGAGSGFVTFSVGGADFNRDGRVDAVFTAPYVGANAGRAYVFDGDASLGLRGAPSVTLNARDGVGGYFGYDVALRRVCRRARDRA